MDVVVFGRAAHAYQADRRQNPAFALPIVLDEVARLEELFGQAPDPEVAGITGPYRINVGRVDAGVWHSSVPAEVRIGLRVGHVSAYDADSVVDTVRTHLTRALVAAGWPSSSLDVRAVGFCAQPHHLPAAHPLVAALSDAHNAAHGAPCGSVMLGSTTDARFYINQARVPAVAYGPVVRNMHGRYECVELSSITDVARTLMRFFVGYYSETDVAGWELI